MTDEYYRFEDRRCSVTIDAEREIFGLRLEVHLYRYPVVRYTPKGVWIGGGILAPRFVLSSARKKFACPTIELAKESFIARKNRQASIYQARYKDAMEAVRQVQSTVWSKEEQKW